MSGHSVVQRMRPRTAVGQVVWAIAASIFAALLMVAWSPSHDSPFEADRTAETVP